MFNKSFENIEIETIVDEIDKNGYYFLENALDNKFIDSINSDVKKNRMLLNNNKPGGVQLRTQYYNTFMLCISKAFFELCTHKKILDIAKSYLKTKKFRLRAHRYYETYGSHRMQWHTDSKISQNNKYKSKSLNGLIFICYISDVYDGEFQYIRTSHNKSSNFKQYDFSEEEADKIFGLDNIKSFKASKGSLIIYNISGVHRAKPAISSKHNRSSLFFQIDSEDNSEPIYINSKFIDNINEDQKYYLGFGRKSTYREFPISSSKNLPAKFFIKKVLFPWSKEFVLINLKKLLKIFLPKRMISFLKKLN